MTADLNDLAYFVHVVDHGGFAQAGRALDIPKSKLSRRIAALEDRLGVQLIHRSTRSFVVTEIGVAYYGHCRAMLVEADAAQETIDLTRAEPCGVVRMTCPVGLLHATVANLLTKFMVQYPKVELRLEATNRRVDLISEAIDLAIRVRPTPLEDSALVMRSLGDRRQCLVASPGLIKQYASPADPAELTQLPSMAIGRHHAEFEWLLNGPEKRQVRIKHKPRFVTLDMAALCSAAVAGVGVVQLPHLVVGDQLLKGDLIELLPEWSPPTERIHVVFSSRRGLLLSVRTLIDFLVAEFQKLRDD